MARPKMSGSGNQYIGSGVRASQQQAAFKWTPGFDLGYVPYTESHWGTVNEERIEGKFRIEFNLKRCTNCNVNILYRLEYPVPQFGDEMVTELGKIECPGCQTIITTGDFKTTPVGHTLRIIDSWTDNVDIQGFKPNLLEEREQELHNREFGLDWRERTQSHSSTNPNELEMYELIKMLAISIPHSSVKSLTRRLRGVRLLEELIIPPISINEAPSVVQLGHVIHAEMVIDNSTLNQLTSVADIVRYKQEVIRRLAHKIAEALIEDALNGYSNTLKKKGHKP